ncbi:MAG: 4-(cytidine 5'-diphospho)-2-C-methyl-D-erythritol kinase [Paracoccaceae bacterium]
MTSRLARAKINLALHVGARRADGFHQLDSIVCFAGIGDRVAVFPDTGVRLEVRGPMADGVPIDGDNLIMKAAALFGGGHGARIILEKHLPVAAGIGGGSADAAAALRLLGEKWGQELPPVDRLRALGADVPVCLAGVATRMRGIGERLDPLTQMPKLDAVLVNPGVPLATRDVFSNLATPDGGELEAPVMGGTFGDWIAYLARQRNDLEKPAIGVCPEIVDVLEMLNASETCDLARMSGSGATCFGLFASSDQAANAAADISARHPAWWVRPTVLGRSDDPRNHVIGQRDQEIANG